MLEPRIVFFELAQRVAPTPGERLVFLSIEIDALKLFFKRFLSIVCLILIAILSARFEIFIIPSI